MIEIGAAATSTNMITQPSALQHHTVSAPDLLPSTLAATALVSDWFSLRHATRNVVTLAVVLAFPAEPLLLDIGHILWRSLDALSNGQQTQHILSHLLARSAICWHAQPSVGTLSHLFWISGGLGSQSASGSSVQRCDVVNPRRDDGREPRQHIRWTKRTCSLCSTLLVSGRNYNTTGTTTPPELRLGSDYTVFRLLNSGSVGKRASGSTRDTTAGKTMRNASVSDALTEKDAGEKQHN